MREKKVREKWKKRGGENERSDGKKKKKRYHLWKQHDYLQDKMPQTFTVGFMYCQIPGTVKYRVLANTGYSHKVSTGRRRLRTGCSASSSGWPTSLDQCGQNPDPKQRPLWLHFSSWASMQEGLPPKMHSHYQQTV